MAVLVKGNLTIDYTDEGQGPAVVLIHSSVSANRQWRALSEALKDRYRVLAINLFGYGETTPWPGTAPQSLYAQAQLVLALCEDFEGPVHLVGHSFGGSVALKAAMLLGPRVGSLILLEWNALTARTLVVSDPATRHPIREIAGIFAQACPHWSFRSVAGGHMAPLTHPEIINPIVREFLDAGAA